MNSRYERGRAELQYQQETKREERGMLFSVLIVLGLFGLGIGAVVLLGGCASSSKIAVAESLQELGQQATASGLIQVAQMGEDCTSQDRALKHILRDIMTDQKVPAPQKIEVRPLAGSSLCGFSQGTANEVATLELGARNTARAQVKMYWSDITYTNLQKAQSILDAMRPIPAAASKTAHTPAK